MTLTDEADRIRFVREAVLHALTAIPEVRWTAARLADWFGLGREEVERALTELGTRASVPLGAEPTADPPGGMLA